MLLTNPSGWQAWRVRIGLLGALICFLIGCSKVGSNDSQKDPVSKDAVRLLFTYGSEKEDWVKDVTADFNQGRHKTKGGRPIYVDAVPEGSGECVDNIINDIQKADVVSPASEAFIKLGNAQGRYESSGLKIELGSVCEPPKAEVINNLLGLWQRTSGNR